MAWMLRTVHTKQKLRTITMEKWRLEIRTWKETAPFYLWVMIWITRGATRNTTRARRDFARVLMQTEHSCRRNNITCTFTTVLNNRRHFICRHINWCCSRTFDANIRWLTCCFSCLPLKHYMTKNMNQLAVQELASPERQKTFELVTKNLRCDRQYHEVFNEMYDNIRKYMKIHENKRK